MKIACLGGGPAGLYFAISMKLQHPAHDIVVYERNKADDTFGWGVVFSDETLDNFAINDAKSATEIRQHFAYWDDIAVLHKGQKTVSSGHGFCGIGRKQLLIILQRRARELGVELCFEKNIENIEEYQQRYDLVIAADGLHSKVRTHYAEQFKPDIDTRKCKFVWLGTRQKFDDAFTFIFEKTAQGWVWAHAYQFDDELATFIVECSNETYENFGFDRLSQQQSIEICEEIFSAHLAGNQLLANTNHVRGSAWINFPRVLCQRWSYENVVLMGDAAATAHFSIGSGTKLAMESAIALAQYLHSEANVSDALSRYEDTRRLEVLKLQSAARNSLEWFEDIERYLNLDPVQFNYSLLTRSQRISHENLRVRDKQWLESAEQWFRTKDNFCSEQSAVEAPMFTPYRLREMTLVNRIVVSPMAQYKAVQGATTDWHLVHYGTLAKGGAGLIIVEMTCVSADGRITLGCPGLYCAEHLSAWQKITAFVHGESEAKICAQLGHAGRKGSTQRGWEKMDAPLDDQESNWPLISASAIPWSDDNQTPVSMTLTMMEEVTRQFVDAALMAVEAGFDMLEVHCAHGYLLSSFISPVSNQRQDEFGGSLENRMRFPLAVIRAIRRAIPEAMPLSVRISAHDWVGEAGITPQDAVEIAQWLQHAEVDICDVSSGQTSIHAEPVYGRMYQTPLSDRIRNETQIATMAVGNIYQADHVNSILMAGRADLVCLARPHLADPFWTLHAAATMGNTGTVWPKPYLAGRDQLFRLTQKNDSIFKV